MKSNLSIKTIEELKKFHLDTGLSTIEDLAMLEQDLKCICGLDPEVEYRAILIAELQAFITKHREKK